ncbi:MAG: hypothetical protein JST94_11405 [Bacteroidetes bacterium]|nr:hypothetical protein [Bacteroidota bacterium]MBS1672032.1 hypothetical protein [Bacteroidota bacterium]
MKQFKLSIHNAKSNIVNRNNNLHVLRSWTLKNKSREDSREIIQTRIVKESFDKQKKWKSEISVPMGGQPSK